VKVLVISLSSLDDFMLALPVLGGLKTQHRVRRLDVLTFEPGKSLHPMLGDVDHWWTLTGDEPQEAPRGLLDQISAVGYDCVINLTQTDFSGRIAGSIPVRRRIGMAIDSRGRTFFNSPWIQYLEDHPGSGNAFHAADIFFQACGLSVAGRAWRLNETPAGRDEARALECAPGERIVFQPFSPGARHWPESAWLDCLSRLQLLRPRARFALLCAPPESDLADALLEGARARGIRAEKAAFSLAGAFSLLKSSRVLVSGGGAVQHLANAANVRILELSLGSGAGSRSRVYASDSLILQPRAARDGGRLSPELTAAAAHHLLLDDWPLLAILAREYANEAAVFRTLISGSGYWMTQDLNESRPRAALESLVERSTLTFFLNQEHRQPLPPFGSEGMRLKSELERLLPDEPAADLHRHLEFIAAQAAGQASAGPAAGPDRTAKDLFDITEARRRACATGRAAAQSEIKRKLIRALKSQLPEPR
jgi:ADP-heptose:LPS heptosyltransferase